MGGCVTGFTFLITVNSLFFFPAEKVDKLDMMSLLQKGICIAKYTRDHKLTHFLHFSLRAQEWVLMFDCIIQPLDQDVRSWCLFRIKMSWRQYSFKASLITHEEITWRSK